MIFHDASRYCYDWLKAQSFVKEESLTDWLLYYISNHNRNVYYKAFTKMDPIGSGGFLQMNSQLPKHIVCLFKQKN